MSALTKQEIWVCNWCRNMDPGKKWYEVDFRVSAGNCDRCTRWTVDLWHMVRRSVLDVMVDIL